MAREFPVWYAANLVSSKVYRRLHACNADFGGQTKSSANWLEQYLPHLCSDLLAYKRLRDPLSEVLFRGVTS